MSLIIKELKEMLSGLYVLFLALFVLGLLGATVIFYYLEQKSLKQRFDKQSEAYRYF